MLLRGSNITAATAATTAAAAISAQCVHGFW